MTIQSEGVKRDLPLVTLSGGPREQGGLHGEALAEEIRHNVDLYRRRLMTDARLRSSEVTERAEVYLGVFTRLSPEYRAAMEGVAGGSGTRLTDIVMLNARYEMMYSAYSAIGMAEAAMECTAFAASRAVTADGHLWAGQTWDWIPEVRGALLEIAGDGLRTLAFTEAGIVGGKIGMNSAGVGLLINGLLSNYDDWSRQGIPFHLRTARILRSRTFDEAVSHARDGDRACSANFLIARGGGPQEEVVDLETSPQGVCELHLRGGTLAHANHFMDPHRLGITQPLREERVSTYQRCDRMERQLKERTERGPLSPGDMEEMLRDHEGHPDSICRHPNPKLPEDERSETVFAVLMDLDALEMRYTAGPPCTLEFRMRHLGIS